VLGEDERTVRVDVEDPAAAAHQLDVGFDILFDEGRETRGPGLVVSDAAVFDANLHQLPPCRIVAESRDPC
jgi:hypothetical protein